MAALLAYPVRSPQWLLNYKGVNITADISQMVLGVTYTDHLSGLAGENMSKPITPWATLCTC